MHQFNGWLKKCLYFTTMASAIWDDDERALYYVFECMIICTSMKIIMDGELLLPYCFNAIMAAG